MRKFILIAFACTATCFSNYCLAQNSNKLKIEEVTVFLNGAQLISTASVNFKKGENEIIFTNVAANVNAQSLSVGATNNVIMEESRFKNDFLLPENLSTKAKAIKDSIEQLTFLKQETANKISVLNEELAIFKENRKVSGNQNGLSVAELQKMLDMVNSKMESILAQISKAENQQKKTDEIVTKLNKQLDQERKKEVPPGGQLIIKFFAPEAVTSNVFITYIVPNAGWTPCYDIKVEDITQPVKLFYKANVHQNCGVKWDNVHLYLSTGNPNEGVQAPVISPIYLSFYTPPAVHHHNANAAMAAPPRAVETRSYAKHLENSQTLSEDEKNLEESTINNYVSVDNSGVNTTFNIDLPYNIPSDGQNHMVAVKKYEVPASYRYFAAPKIDKDVFLQAMITKWEDLNLLPGKTSIFYEGTYVGQGNLDVNNVKDTIHISLGRDKKIVVKRERDTKMRSVKYIGTNTRETFGYTISMRNTGKEKINLIIEDQIPVTTDKDIEIEDKETGSSDLEENTGLLKWALNINPNETQEIKFGFTIKYPKGKIVSNLPK